jgi:transcriptional regulator with XRE-family HTH domain
MIDDAEFARRLRMLRAYLDLTLEEASGHLDLSASTLSKREHADENGTKMRTADRFHMAAVYIELSGWPPEFFTEERMPSIPVPRPVEDDLDPADVVDLVERDRDGGEGSAEPG